jgi:hypothetical protein
MVRIAFNSRQGCTGGAIDGARANLASLLARGRKRLEPAEVFAIDHSLRVLWHASQVQPSSDSWSSWELLGGRMNQIEAIRNSDGRLEVFAISRDDALMHTWQTRASTGPWSGWGSRHRERVDPPPLCSRCAGEAGAGVGDRLERHWGRLWGRLGFGSKLAA